MAGDFFDERAATWDEDPSRVERARAAAQAIRTAVPLAPSTRLLEYGAGTAMTSQVLADDVGDITLAEPSSGMRAVLADKIAGGVLPATTRVWDLDLASAAAPDEQFDLIVTVMTLHHIPDLDAVLKGFATLLPAGGHLCIVDLQSEDGSFHSNDPNFEGHHGFEQDSLTARLRAAGFSVPAWQHIHQIDKNGVTYPLFLAVSARA
ncbi:MAG: class I SAM-dependent methyltransferase [Aldersonia sp.]|nr:class I SAM-dependent methyltransferase [Aldersonia sp.]